jgi:hypothetical protein
MHKLPKQKKRALAASSRSLIDVRNAFEHIDEYIQKDKIVEGEFLMLSISDGGDRAEIGPYQVEFGDLAKTLRHLYEFGLMLFELRDDQTLSQDEAEAN